MQVRLLQLLLAHRIVAFFINTHHHTKYTTIFPSTSRLSLSIASVELCNWGVFNNITLNLAHTPCYTALTGDTGTGKSIFISALQYLCGVSKYSKFTTNGFIQLRLLENDTSITTIKRAYNAITKKSVCEIDGKRILVKDLVEYTRSKIKFWSPEDITKLEDAFLAYVDEGVIGASPALLSAAYEDWSRSHDQAQVYAAMHERMHAGDDSELIQTRDELERISTLESKTERILSEVLSEVCHDEGVSREDDTQLDQLATAVRASFMPLSGLDLTLAWQAVCASEVYVKKLLKTLDVLGLSSERSAERLPLAAGTDKSELRAMALKLTMLGETLASVQGQLRVLGWGRGTEDSLEDACREVQIAAASTTNAQRHLTRLVQSVAPLPLLAGRLTALRVEWEALCKRLSTAPSTLEMRRLDVSVSLNTMLNASSLLQEENARRVEARLRYAQLAHAQTSARMSSAAALSHKLNQLLSALDISNKRLLVRHASLADPRHELSASFVSELLPTSIGVQSSGWDVVGLQVQRHAVVSESADIHEYFKFEVLSASALPSSADVDSELVSTWNKDSSSKIRSVLSSGEQARLAVALELSSLRRDSDAVLVLDEIDAHVGGDAASAIARLLRSHGRRQHVIAVTHNALIAAASDVHLVVRRVDGEDRLSEVHVLESRDMRERELSRMVVGHSGDRDAGLRLANALLDRSAV